VQHFGDVSDYRKFALLRPLASERGGTSAATRGWRRKRKWLALGSPPLGVAIRRLDRIGCAGFF